MHVLLFLLAVLVTKSVIERINADQKCIIISSKSLIGYTLRGKNGLHAFGNNSAESEPNPHSSYSLRRIVFQEKNEKIGSQNF